jgi:hypothetical protein
MDGLEGIGGWGGVDFHGGRLAVPIQNVRVPSERIGLLPALSLATIPGPKIPERGTQIFIWDLRRPPLPVRVATVLAPSGDVFH